MDEILRLISKIGGVGVISAEDLVGLSESRMRVLELFISRWGEWVTRAEICAVGGAEGTRRARELRELGFHLAKRRPDGNKRAWEYRLEIPEKAPKSQQDLF